MLTRPLNWIIFKWNIAFNRMESDREHAASPSTSGPSTNNHHRTGEPIQVLSVIELPNYLDPIAANGREHLSDATDHQPASPSTFEPSTSNHHNMGEQDIIELSSDEEDSRYAVAEPVAVAEPETSTMFPIKCNIGSSCMAVFKTTDGFVEHLHAHHDTRKRMICYLCRRRDSFETKRALRRHMESWHICQMRFQCPFKRCMLSFTREHQLTLHMITHVFNLLNENIN